MYKCHLCGEVGNFGSKCSSCGSDLVERVKKFTAALTKADGTKEVFLTLFASEFSDKEAKDIANNATSLQQGKESFETVEIFETDNSGSKKIATCQKSVECHDYDFYKKPKKAVWWTCPTDFGAYGEYPEGMVPVLVI